MRYDTSKKGAERGSRLTEQAVNPSVATGAINAVVATDESATGGASPGSARMTRLAIHLGKVRRPEHTACACTVCTTLYVRYSTARWARMRPVGVHWLLTSSCALGLRQCRRRSAC